MRKVRMSETDAVAPENVVASVTQTRVTPVRASAALTAFLQSSPYSDVPPSLRLLSICRANRPLSPLYYGGG